VTNLYIFSDLYYPCKISSGYYITEIAEYFADRFNVCVICSTKNTNGTSEWHNGVHIIRLPDPNLDKNNLIQRTIKYGKIAYDFFKIGRKTLKAEDQVICLTNPAFALIGISKLRRRIDFKLTVLVHDVFPENLIGSRILRTKGIIYKFLISQFNKAYKYSDRIIVIGRDMKKLFIKKLHDYNGEIVHIPIWGDPEKIYPVELADKRVYQQTPLNSRLTFQFSGNIGRAQSIDKILKASIELPEDIADFIFFGNGAYKKRLQYYAEKRSNIVYGGVYSRDETNKYLNACDVGLVSLSTGMKGLGVPSKSYDLMAAGKPILFIGPEDSEIASMVIEEQIGWVVTSGSVKELVNRILQISHLEMSEIKRIGEVSRNVLIKKFSKHRVLSMYSNTFN